MALEEEPTVVVTAAAVTGVAATGAAEERMQEVAVAQATEAVEVQVAVALAAVVRCSRSAGPCAGALRLRKHRARRSAKTPPARRLAYRHARDRNAARGRARSRCSASVGEGINTDAIKNSIITDTVTK